MKIGILAPSIYMSPTRYGDMIFAPRDLAINLANGLVDKGHEVTFFTAPDIQTKAKLVGGDSTLISADFLEKKLGNAPNERMRWASFYTIKRNYEMDLVVQAYKMAGEGKLDIIHSYHDTLAHFLDDLTGFPTVYTLHDPMSTDLKTLPSWLLSKYKKQNYVAISDNFRVHDSIGLNFVGTVHHGISVPPTVGNGAGKYLAILGRMVPQKGIHIALDVARKTGLPIKIATSNMEENNSSEYFTGIVKPYTRDAKVEFVPFLKGEAKNKFFADALGFMFPIQWEEPFGMVMLEAMASGTPVIAYNRGSVSEIVKDGATGFIVDFDDVERPGKGSWTIKKRGVEGLVEAVGRIGEIDRAACRKHVEENFSVEKMVRGYEEVYQKVLAAPR